jgi:hypothetical protein
MPFVEPTSNLTARLTDEGRDRLARLILGEVAFELAGFQVGRGGYLQTNPVKTVPIDPALTALIDPVGPLRSFVTIEQPVGTNVAAPVCRLDTGDVDSEFGLGELGVFATYLVHDTQPGLVGTDFLFATAHFPLLAKTPSHTFVWRVLIAL